MPLLDTDKATYILAVCSRFEAGKLDPSKMNLTHDCPECGEAVDQFDGFGHHIVIKDGNDGIGAYVIIGCEGYWVIDPNMVGMDRPDWQSIEAMNADDAAAGYDSHGVFRVVESGPVDDRDSGYTT